MLIKDSENLSEKRSSPHLQNKEMVLAKNKQKERKFGPSSVHEHEKVIP